MPDEIYFNDEEEAALERAWEKLEKEGFDKEQKEESKPKDKN